MFRTCGHAERESTRNRAGLGLTRWLVPDLNVCMSIVHLSSALRRHALS